MRHFAIALILGVLLLPAGARAMRGGGGHGMGHVGGTRFGGTGGGFRGERGFHRGDRFFGGVFIDDPFFYDPVFSPYAYPYGYASAYLPPPVDWQEPSPPEAQAQGGDEQHVEAAPLEDSLKASYGLVQLRGVADGASVDLDGRFWLTAAKLDQRWLALPHGRHTITVRNENAVAVERHVEVESGTPSTVRFD